MAKRKTPNTHWRQGDVLIRPVARMTADVKPEPRDPRRGAILAHGEVTGHAHHIATPRARLFRDDGVGRRFLQIDRPQAGEPATVDLTHEEHSAVPLPPGLYEVLIQQEYSPTEALRAVAD